MSFVKFDFDYCHFRKHRSYNDKPICIRYCAVVSFCEFVGGVKCLAIEYVLLALVYLL